MDLQTRASVVNGFILNSMTSQVKLISCPKLINLFLGILMFVNVHIQMNGIL